jgi:SAM-dependent methyltransferase
MMKNLGFRTNSERDPYFPFTFTQKPFVRRSYHFLKYKVLWEVYGPPTLRIAKRKLLSSDAVSTAEKNLLRNVSCRIHPNDGMYAISSDEEYLLGGLSGLTCIERALKASNEEYNIQNILDLPSGYGRVLRFLKAKFATANITACDIDPAAVEFCGRAFSVTPAVSQIDFSNLVMPDKFDLIWCGSLITHLDEAATARLLKFFHNHLSPGGLCVFTTHGQQAAKWLEQKKHTFGLTESGERQMLSQFYKDGYGYADYPKSHGVGVSLVSYDRMTRIARAEVDWQKTVFLEHAWDNLQDVYGFALPRHNGVVPMRGRDTQSNDERLSI